MGMCASGYIFQSKVDDLIGDIEGIKKYIDDILVLIKNCFRKHIEHLIMIFVRLCAAYLKVNAPECSFGLKDITYIGYFITREDIKPNPKKLHGIMDLGQPATNTEERALIGMIHYYREMWIRQSHILAPMSKAASSPKDRKLLWNESSFKEIKYMVSAETLLSYPYWKLQFTVRTDASAKQLGYVISQNNKSIELFSIILSQPRRNYTTTKK